MPFLVQAGIADRVQGMTGNLAQEEPTVPLNSCPEKNSANHVSQATTVPSLMLLQSQGNVMRDFSVIMALTSNNPLVATGVMQVSVQLDGTAHKVTHVRR